MSAVQTDKFAQTPVQIDGQPPLKTSHRARLLGYLKQLDDLEAELNELKNGGSPNGHTGVIPSA